MKRRFITLALSALVITFLMSSCKSKGTEIFKKSSEAMYTIVTITVSAESSKEGEAAIDAGFEEIRRIEKLANFWADDSELALINKNAGVQAVKVSDDLFEMISEAAFVAEKTNGGFDPTIGPIINLYDFKNKIMPDGKAIKKALPFVNYKEIVLDAKEKTVFLKRKGMSIDTGGIAKGFAAEKAALLLQKRGIKGGVVSVSGDIQTFGLRPDGSPWMIGIKNPRPKSEEEDVMAVIGLSGEAISTSGDYERYMEIDGKRYHHIINPKTGMPTEGTQSVTIVSKRATYSDGFSTGTFVLGQERGMKALSAIGFNAVIVNSKGDRRVTDGIKERVMFR